MSSQTLKAEIETIDGTPEKRLFLSIVSDYGLKTGLLELIDNAIDLWTSKGRKQSLSVDVLLDPNRQIISVVDNAGGVKEEDLRMLIAPGASSNALSDESIGIFGVGGKRAGIALGEAVSIQTRHQKEKSLQIDITTEWLETEDWHIPAYQIPNIDPGTTKTEITKLRQPFDQNAVDTIRADLSETYHWFLKNGCSIELNGTPIQGKSFEKWAFPPGFCPKEAKFPIKPADERSVKVEFTSGLISDRDPEASNYGVYFFCNNRLIVKELKTREVGYFVSSEAGVPHPDASLARTIVKLNGPAELMPWNSSKSGINYTHEVFLLIRPKIIELQSYFSSLSRRTKHNWDSEVLAHKKGSIEPLKSNEILSSKKIVLPKLPRVRAKPRITVLLETNEKLIDAKPWTRGLVEAMGLVDLVTKQGLDTQNRAALILLDSNFEIGLKEFIVNRKDLYPLKTYNDAFISNLFQNRTNVINVVTQHIKLTTPTLNKITYYYSLRNKLIHERATVGITDRQIEDYRKLVERVLKKLFGLKFP